MHAITTDPGANAGQLVNVWRFPSQAFPATRLAGGLPIRRRR
jgi:hypothetical protein